MPLRIGRGRSHGCHPRSPVAARYHHPADVKASFFPGVEPRPVDGRVIRELDEDVAALDGLTGLHEDVLHQAHRQAR